MRKILLLTHFNFSPSGPIHGPAYSISLYLRKIKSPYTLIAHPLYPGPRTYMETFDGRNLIKREIGLKVPSNILLKSLSETFLNVYLSLKEKFSLILAIDPLNFLGGFILKSLGRSKRIVYYTVDYAEKRFSDFVLNSIYHLIDKFSIKNASYIWNVSTRIFEHRKSQGVPDNKNIYVPNAPSFSSFKHLLTKGKDRNRIFMVVGKTHTPILKMAIKAFIKVAKKFPKAKLILAGPTEVKITRRKNIVSLGVLSHDKLMQEMAVSGLGLALYTKDFDWTYYGDSMKAREYLCAGLPVIITNIVSTAEDVKKFDAGLVINPKELEIYYALNKFLSDEKYWNNARRQALVAARVADIDNILKNAFNKVYEKTN